MMEIIRRAGFGQKSGVVGVAPYLDILAGGLGVRGDPDYPGNVRDLCPA